MDKGCFNFCLEQYNYYFDKSYKEQIESFKGRALTERRKEEFEIEAQKQAIKFSIISGMEKFPNIGVAEIWSAIFQVHMYRKSGISDKDVIDKVISADQSWKKSSGHAFEEMVKSIANLNLEGTNIEVILQRDLNNMIGNKEIHNEPRDISWLKEQIAGNIFDLYAITRKNGKTYCFGCIQAKTSIRDRVTRDREPSIQAMESFFWSCIFVLDGAFLKLPKFQHMVNGGSGEFQKNGWHGMYCFSDDFLGDRIYKTDLDLLNFKEHIIKASEYWQTQRQWMNRDWRADQ